MENLELKKSIDGTTLNVRLIGRLDTVNSNEAAQDLTSSLEGVERLVLDFTELSYISSSGLRILLQLMKLLKAKNGELLVCHPSAEIMEVFKMTGFSGLLNIQN